MSKSQRVIPTDGRHVTYSTSYRKCGKPYCGTCKKGQGHGPYLYAFWRDDNKVFRTKYIGKANEMEAKS